MEQPDKQTYSIKKFKYIVESNPVSIHNEESQHHVCAFLKTQETK